MSRRRPISPRSAACEQVTCDPDTEKGRMPIGYEHLRHPRDIGPGLVTPEVCHETPLEATRCAFYAPIICRVMDNVDPALGHSSLGA